MEDTEKRKRIIKVMLNTTPKNWKTTFENLECLDWAIGMGVITDKGRITKEGKAMLAGAKQRADELLRGVLLNERYVKDAPPNKWYYGGFTTKGGKTVNWVQSGGLLLLKDKKEIRDRFRTDNLRFLKAKEQDITDKLNRYLAGEWHRTTPFVWQTHFLNEISLIWMKRNVLVSPDEQNETEPDINLIPIQSAYYDTVVRMGAAHFETRDKKEGENMRLVRASGNGVFAIIAEYSIAGLPMPTTGV